MVLPLSDCDKPGVFPTTVTTINVRFVPFSPFELPVKNQPMKLSNQQPSPLLALAAHLENFALPTATQIHSKTNLVPLALLPEKFAVAKNENSFYAPTRQLLQLPKAKIPGEKKQFHIFENPLDGLRNTEFRMEAPSANAVQLAGDFTDWEKSPLDLVQSFDGTWFTIVPLLPGTYSYRFIVDGQWLDDPQSVQHVPNPFGSEDAVLSVE